MQYEQDVKRLEAKYGPLLDDPNGASTPALAAAAELAQRKLAGELAALDAKYDKYIADPDSRLQRGVDAAEPYTQVAPGVISLLPSPYRELGLAGLGLFTTIMASIKSRRKWKNVSEELLYARSRLEARVAESDIDTAAFKKERDTAEGEALNPETVDVLRKAR
ncbi:MAG: hypothetical protein MI892_02815 [Desulfobacterales bacterium]|nr:hypothetical protein [Desulfobacterales bacterium]